MRYLVLGVLCLAISGCDRPQPGTPAEQEAQSERMRGFLNDSSPRNMNEHPKVTPEVRETFNLNRGDKTRDNAAASKSEAEMGEDL